MKPDDFILQDSRKQKMRNNSYNLFNTIIHNNNVIEYRRETRDKRVIRKIKYVNGRARIEREREMLRKLSILNGRNRF